MMIHQNQTLRESLQHERVERYLHHTDRTDWESLADQLHQQVISPCPFGLAVVTKNPLASRKRLVLRTNDRFDPIAAIYFLREHFRAGHYDVILHATEDPVRHDRFDLYQVADPWLGLPVKSLVYVIEHAQRPELNLMLVFGGERIKGQIEYTLRAVEKILTSQPAGPAGADPRAPSKGALLEVLRTLAPEEFERQDLHSLSGLVNGLANVIENAPSSLKAKYNLLCDKVLARTKE